MAVNLIQGKQIATASWSQNAVTASYATQALSASFAISSSRAISSSFATSASLATNSDNIGITDNPSYGGVTYYPTFVGNTSGYTSVFVDSSVFTYNPSTNILTTTASRAISSSFATQALSASWAPTQNINTSSFATTGSNIFIGNQVITGSVTATQGFTTNWGTDNTKTALFGTDYPLGVNNRQILFNDISNNDFTYQSQSIGLLANVEEGFGVALGGDPNGTPVSSNISTTLGSSKIENTEGTAFGKIQVYPDQLTITADNNAYEQIIQLKSDNIQNTISNKTTTEANTIELYTDRVYTKKYITTDQGFIGSYLQAPSITGSLFGTASYAISSSQAVTASFAATSSYPIAASGSSIYSITPSGLSTGRNNTILLGPNAGAGATSIYNSNFIGISAGQSATNAYQSTFIGPYAGAEATKADDSNFIGLFAGYKAVSASFSNLIGWQAGKTEDPLLSIGSNNIIIGTNITLPPNTRDSINLGGIIFATGSYSNTGGFTYSGSQSGIGKVGINKVTPQYTLDVSGSGNYSNGLTVTGSLIATSSWATNAVTASYVLNAVSSSYSTTSSYALNGGVTQIIAGTNISITNGGSGSVTISSTGGGSGAGANITGSFTNQSTWSFVHGLGNRGVVVQTYDTDWNQIIPQNITLTDVNTATIIFPSNQSGYAIATLGGVTSIVNAVSSSYALTSSFVSTLNQNVIITGSLAVGTGSIGSGESNLILGPAPAGGVGEGGQIGLLGTGGIYTSSSFIDTYQNQIRIIAGQGTTSTTGILAIDLGNKNAVFQGAVTASAFNGLPNDYLYAIRSGSNQTVGSAWANTDVIFNSVNVSKGISFNTSTGVASLTGGRVYRVTARLAWSAAAAYNLQFSCYTSTNTKIGPDVEIVQASNGTSNISDGTLEFLYAPTSNTDIKIRCTANNTALSGEQIRADLNTQFIIQQIA